jgi:hypothetical protein
MLKSSNWRLVSRVVVALVVTALAVLMTPAPWLAGIGLITEFMVDTGTSWLHDVTVSQQSGTLTLHAGIDLGLILQDGNLLSPLPGTWSKNGTPSLQMLVVAVTVWAAARQPWKIRLIALPVVLLLAALAASFVLLIEVQETALSHIGSGLLDGLPLAPVETNLTTAKALANQWTRVEWIKAFLDAGGRLFLAVLAGFVGHSFYAPHTHNTKPANKLRTWIRSAHCRHRRATPC